MINLAGLRNLKIGMKTIKPISMKKQLIKKQIDIGTHINYYDVLIQL
jgi:hypothetical protein